VQIGHRLIDKQNSGRDLAPMRLTTGQD
jgi:hypothetical protein